jgi:hypothetical protein
MSSASSGETAATSSSSTASGMMGGSHLTPSPLVSRGAKIDSPQDSAKNAFDGDFATSWDGETPSGDFSVPNTWVTIQIPEGPTSILFVWHSTGCPDYQVFGNTNFGVPTDYTIEVSSDGVTWTNAVTVASEPLAVQTYRSRAHRIAFTGMSWVRMTILRAISFQPGPPHPSIGEIEIHDVSNSSDDSWLFAGNGATRFAYDGHVKPSWPALIHASHPTYDPMMIDIADLPGKSSDLVANLDAWLQLNPDYTHWVLAYGLADAEGGQSPADTNFKANMQAAIDKLRAAGKQPILPHVLKTTDADHTQVPAFNKVIDELIVANFLEPAPDLYAWFAAHPEQFCANECEGPQDNGVTPTEDGYVSMNKLWATELGGLYSP